MRIEQVVVNASPLIVLLRSGQAELLPRLFNEIVIPEAVWQEAVMGGHRDRAALGLQVAPWAKSTPGWIFATGCCLESGCGGVRRADVRFGEPAVPGGVG